MKFGWNVKGIRSEQIYNFAWSKRPSYGFFEAYFRPRKMSRRASYTGGPNLPTGKSNGFAGQENGGAPFGPAAPPRKRWLMAKFYLGGGDHLIKTLSQMSQTLKLTSTFRSALSKGGLMFGSQNNLSYLSSAAATSKDSTSSSTLKPGRIGLEFIA